MWSWALTWGCIPELSRNCLDMTNSSSTYLGIIASAILGGILSWWIFNRQKKTSGMQDYTLSRIEQLENHNEKLLEKIFDLNKKIDSLFEGH